MDRIRLFGLAVVMGLLAGSVLGADLRLDEKAAVGGEWGYRPGDGDASAVNPPSFSWRPVKGMVWEVQCARDAGFADVVYRVEKVEFNVHCPPRVFEPGAYYWRYRGTDSKGQVTNWSIARKFSIGADAVRMPMPLREELLGRIPKSHPRLFVRPENVGKLKAAAAGPLKKEFAELVRECDKLMANPVSTVEPATYPKDIVRNSDPWREIWWGNREKVIRTLNGAATLGFTRLIGGKEQYGQEARRILLECAKWDPKGSTGYRYNDEAGMPYNYYFSRTYSFINDLLNEQEKDLCRKVMKIRGDEMYAHLCPGHLWRPYGSHQNRAWHFLGEVGIAFLGEVEGADDWVWFAMNVFFNAYPVWSDDDGGWHEGTSYWASYQNRFTWWADVMREAMGIDAYRKPYYSQAGYYAMYLMPPGKVGGGFGDLTAARTAKSNVPLMSDFAAQAGNGHWQWYVEQLGGPTQAGGYIGFVRGQLPKVEPVSPKDLPASRLFAGTGQAYLNTSILDAGDSVQVVFKSSPFGTQSHGYEASNSFLLWGYGQRLLIRSGYRDSYGSDHHKGWMWSTRSVNNITVGGKGQFRRDVRAQGGITDFVTTPAIDIVSGEAGGAYEDGILERFTRSIVFVKPDLVIVYDRLAARQDTTFEYGLHAINKFDVGDQRSITVRKDDAGCAITFLSPAALSFTQTDQYDPNPRPRIKLREWHLTASTAEKSREMQFASLYRPFKEGMNVPNEASLEQLPGGYLLTAEVGEGRITALLPIDDAATLEAEGMETKGRIRCRVVRKGNSAEATQGQ